MKGPGKGKYCIVPVYIFCVFLFQLAGTAVFALGLWLRLDPKTKGLFEGSESPYVFYAGKSLIEAKFKQALQFYDLPNTNICMCVCRCIHPDSSWSPDDGGGFSRMLWGYPGVTLYAGTGSYHYFIQPKIHLCGFTAISKVLTVFYSNNTSF